MKHGDRVRLNTHNGVFIVTDVAEGQDALRVRSENGGDGFWIAGFQVSEVLEH